MLFKNIVPVCSFPSIPFIISKPSFACKQKQRFTPWQTHEGTGCEHFMSRTGQKRKKSAMQHISGRGAAFRPVHLAEGISGSYRCVAIRNFRTGMSGKDRPAAGMLRSCHKVIIRSGFFPFLSFVPVMFTACSFMRLSCRVLSHPRNRDLLSHIDQIRIVNIIDIQKPVIIAFLRILPLILLINFQ